MAEQQSVARERSQSKRDKEQGADARTSRSGHQDDDASYEEELAAYLQERIKPGLNSGAIPLLARSIAKGIAHREQLNGTSEVTRPEDEPSAEPEVEPSAAADDPSSAEGDDEPAAGHEREGDADEEPSAETGDAESDESNAPPDFEADMRELQAELGEDWIVRFSVHGKDGWLTAEKDDGSQRLEAPDASVLVEAVGLLNEGGGRST